MANYELLIASDTYNLVMKLKQWDMATSIHILSSQIAVIVWDVIQLSAD